MGDKPNIGDKSNMENEPNLMSLLNIENKFKGYNTVYNVMSQRYEATRYIVVKKFDAVGSILYIPNNIVENKYLADILELICSDNLQVVITNRPDVYMEYAPYTIERDLKSIIRYAMEN